MNIIGDPTDIFAEKPRFGGCRNLLAQYKVTGRALLKIESHPAACSLSSRLLQGEFRENVAFVPLEVLESYLEDLLDLTISDEQLFIAKERSFKGGSLLLGVLTLVLFGVASFFLARKLLLLLGVLYGLSLLVLGYWNGSRKGPVRRVFFARILSREVSRRRGESDGPFAWNGPSFNLRDIFRGERRGGPVHGAASSLFSVPWIQ